MQRVRVVDSHTGGEPTRVVLEGGPDLIGQTMSEKLNDLRQNHDKFRSAVVNEPRGADAIVGALLLPPTDKTCQLGVIFFNNVGYLGMCGHGTIGLCATLAQLKSLGPGELKIDTPAGPVSATVHSDTAVTVTNVPSYRLRKDVQIAVPDVGPVTGDVAYGGNWFFFAKGVSAIAISLENIDALTDLAWRIRLALKDSRITGADGAEIDHIELFGPPRNNTAHLRNFVLCPGKSYDRSPCGTGTSAKMACLYEDGQLKPGDKFIQESICGSLFEGSITLCNGKIIPSIRGSAYITAESELVLNPADPFCWGIAN